MICKNCGAKNDADALYCEKCGKVMKSVVTNSKFTLIFIIVATIFIIIGLVGAVLILDNSQNSSNNVETIDNENFDLTGIPLKQVPNLASEISKLRGSFETISYGSVTLTKNQCIYILAKAIVIIDSGQNSNIPLNSYSSPYDPYGTVSFGEITKSQYVDMAERTVSWMDINGATPNYIGISTPGQPDISPSNLLIIFSNALIEYGSTGSLPASVSF